MGISWTEEQRKVIELRGRDILVSAAAGSGKTAVLVERIIRRITDEENPVEIDNLLVVTFTKAAAAQMRERIRAAIEKACDEAPDNSHLRRQSALIHNAMITTIDSFCLFVVRNHFEEIGLDPNFRIADEGEVRLLEMDTLAEVFEANYAAEENGAFLRLIDAYAGKRSDQAVKDMVAKIYRMSLSSPWPLEWIEGLAEPYRARSAGELMETELIRDIAATAALLLGDLTQQLGQLHELALAPDGPNAYAAAVGSDLEQLGRAKELDDYGKLADFFGGLSFARLPAIRKFAGDAKKKELVQNGRNRIKKELEALKEKYFAMDIPSLLEQLSRLCPAVEELVRLTLEYARAMAEVKRKKRIVDFSDIEHFALQILVDSETKQCKRTAEEFRAHFAEIMIDEYQDSNQVQEEIMRAISREAWGEHNMFMVGDVKQSIYRFRLARPELFMEKYEAFDTGDSVTQRIDLHQNFRSRREVVDFCNDIFYKIMSPDLGRVAYNEEAALYAGAPYPECAGMEAELLLLDEADELLAPPEKESSVQPYAESEQKEGETGGARTQAAQQEGEAGGAQTKQAAAEREGVTGGVRTQEKKRSVQPYAEPRQKEGEAGGAQTKQAASKKESVAGGEWTKQAAEEGSRRLEARVIGSRIRRLMSEMTVEDQAAEGQRKLRYSDIVILLRSLKDWGDEFVQVLGDLGIPAHVESATGYFSAIEVQTVLAFLQILDNPYQDIPMAAVLKSPMVGLDDEELAEIRLTDTSVPFSAAALRAMREAKEGSLYDFCRVYEELRAKKDVPVHELIQLVLDRTGYGHFAAAMPAGAQRSANLHMLIEKAIAYERTSYRGLFHFVRYMDQLRKYEIDFGEADVTGENADVVHIMTIHKSKGLEYPVVFVSGLGRRINQMDTSERLVVHPELGLGICEIAANGRVRVKKNCLYRQALADRLRRENLGEELRVLYVALTRAKEKLILTASVKDLGKALEKYTGNTREGEPISYRQRAEAASHLDFILPAMLSYPEKYEIAAINPGDLVWETVESAAQQRLQYGELLARIQEADDALVQQYREQFAYQYPYRSEAGRKSKYSVSELKHDSMVQKFDREESGAEIPDFLREERESYIPDFARKARSGRELSGTDFAGKDQSGQTPAKPDFAQKAQSGCELSGTDFAQKVQSGRELSGTNFAREDQSGQTPAKEAAASHGGVSQGALRGTAVHRVMECMDFVRLRSLDRNNAEAAASFVQEELARMAESGELTQELHGLVIPAVIEGFVASDVAFRMAEAAVRGDLYRERPFVMQEEGVLIQGIIDVFWLEGDSIVLLDYKTDRVDTAQELILRYETQLKLYAKALERIFSTETRQMRAEECLIYSFRLQEVVRI